MTAPEAGNGRVIVQVRDTINHDLAGHRGCRYTSPPQPVADALALVALLLDRPATPAEHGQRTWTRPVAGGRRTITLLPAG